MHGSRYIAIGLALIAFGAAGCGSSQQTVTETVAADTTESAESNLVPVTALTPDGVESCLKHGERATVLSSEWLNPGEPINAFAVFAISSESGARMGIVLTLKPFITKRLSRELAEEGSYEINITPTEEAVVVLDGKASVGDKVLASECAEPG